MACDIDDREGESPSPMEPRLGRMFHSSATGRREQTLPEALGLRQALHPRDDTAEVPAVRRGRPGAPQPTEPRSRAQPGCATRIGNLFRSDRIRGDRRPSQNAPPLKILRRPQPPEAGAQNDGLNALIGGRVLGDIAGGSRPHAWPIVASRNDSSAAGAELVCGWASSLRARSQASGSCRRTKSLEHPPAGLNAAEGLIRHTGWNSTLGVHCVPPGWRRCARRRSSAG